MYEFTVRGVECLYAWAVNICQMRRRLTEFLEAYEVQFEMNDEGGESNV